jgi:hypothetical protein
MRAAGGFPERQNKANWPAGLGAWPAGSAEFEVSSVKPERSGIQPSDFKLHTSNCILLEKRLTASLRTGFRAKQSQLASECVSVNDCLGKEL